MFTFRVRLNSFRIQTSVRWGSVWSSRVISCGPMILVEECRYLSGLHWARWGTLRTHDFRCTRDRNLWCITGHLICHSDFIGCWKELEERNRKEEGYGKEGRTARFKGFFAAEISFFRVAVHQQLRKEAWFRTTINNFTDGLQSGPEISFVVASPRRIGGRGPLHQLAMRIERFGTRPPIKVESHSWQSPCQCSFAYRRQME